MRTSLATYNHWFRYTSVVNKTVQNIRKQRWGKQLSLTGFLFLARICQKFHLPLCNRVNISGQFFYKKILISVRHVGRTILSPVKTRLTLYRQEIMITDLNRINIERRRL